MNIRPIAIYLPQFHPIPENDEWWGKGFTEWTNVTKAKPRFKGHYQPHLPADLGFYDLRLEETRLAQEALAKEYGIYGFCYYHYWFTGKRLLNEPIDRKIENSKEDLPFMLCWANENWTKAWDGLDREVLISQSYSEKDDIIHFEFLCDHFFKDPRYITHDNKPVFIVYRPKLFPDIKKTLDVWRDVALKKGIGELHLGYMQSWEVSDSPESMGFDFAVEFAPNFSYKETRKVTFALKIKNKIKYELGIKDKVSKIKNRFINYDEYVKNKINTEFKENVSPGIMPMWDNSPRRKTNAVIFRNSTPEKYGQWLRHIITNFPWNKNKEKFIFINAWNEWAEGNHLEPCQKWGRSYLEETKKALHIKI